MKILLSNKKSFVAGFILGWIAGWTTSKIPWGLVALLMFYAFILGSGLQKAGWLP